MMSDIVETNNGGFPVKNASYWRRQAMNKDNEIKSLRQRVVELEKENRRLKVAWDSAYKQAMENGQRVDELENMNYIQAEANSIIRQNNDILKKNLRLPAMEAIYAAWHGAGVAVAGGDWKRFAGMLPTLYTSAPTIPEGWQLNSRERQLLDGMIGVQLDHAARCDNISNRTMAEKQKAWDMERVALLQKILAAAPAGPRPTDYKPGEVK